MGYWLTGPCIRRRSMGGVKELTALRYTLTPLLLIAVCTPFVLVVWDMQVSYSGSVSHLFSAAKEKGIGHLVVEAVLKTWPTQKTIVVFLSFLGSQLLLDKVLPGKQYSGPITEKNNVPKYADNGFTVYIISILGYTVAAESGIISGSVLAEELGRLLLLQNVAALFLCAFLTFKGLHFPSTTDSGSTGSWALDFYWGTELYPNIFGWDVKRITNCRFGMMQWALITVSYCYLQIDTEGSLHGSLAVSSCLQMIYVTKFFWWESGYMKSIDIMHDRAGYYICWGCMVWLPCLYTSMTQWIYFNKATIINEGGWSTDYGVLIFALGVAMIFLNYDVDCQRAVFREHSGRVLVFGSKPGFIEAKYTPKGSKRAKTSLLLVSGYWGLSCHFGYLTEIAASFLWSAPAMYTHVYPYVYALPSLIILLFDRAVRDDQRCSKKYGDSWQAYRDRVRWRVIPFVY